MTDEDVWIWPEGHPGWDHYTPAEQLSLTDRSDGWDRRLEDAVSIIASSERTDEAHCDVVAVCEAIEAMLGVTLHSTRQDAKALFESLGLEPVNRFSAVRGDVGVVVFEGRYLAGVVSSAGFVVRMTHGVSIFSITDIEQAYKIGA
ncbi:DUF6950 family protein [Agrobacterium sp. rho-8.1]|nr:hypothetical protein [Agrobacterium sp. rho-8.1]